MSPAQLRIDRLERSDAGKCWVLIGWHSIILTSDWSRQVHVQSWLPEQSHIVQWPNTGDCWAEQQACGHHWWGGGGDGECGTLPPGSVSDTGLHGGGRSLATRGLDTRWWEVGRGHGPQPEQLRSETQHSGHLTSGETTFRQQVQVSDAWFWLVDTI